MGARGMSPYIDKHKEYIYGKKWRLARAEGRPTSRLDADAARANAERLYALNCSMTAIGHAAGMSPTGITHLLRGDYATMQRRNAIRLASLTLHDVIDRALPKHYLPRWAAARRIHALMAIGWTHDAITEHLRPGLRSHNIVGSKAHGPYLRAHTWRDMDRVYRLLCVTPGPSEKSRKIAAREGWAPPLAWDDIDDPDAVPDLGDRAQGVDLDEFVFLVKHGVSLSEAAYRLGVQIDSIYVQARRRERPDVLDLINIARRAA